MNAHPAGPLHAGVLHPAESAGRTRAAPAELDALAPAVWPRGARRGDDGAVVLAGVDVRDLAERYGTPLFVIDEADFRARAAEFAAAFGARSVHYAAKAFLCTEVARWVADEGLSLDVCSGGELAVALRAGFPAERIAFHGNNKSIDELVAAVEAGVGYVVVDSLQEIARLDAVARERGATVPVMIRLTVGVEAHTHEFIATAHEDQKFGFSITGGPRATPPRRSGGCLKAGALTLVGLHSHIGSQIFDTEGFQVAAHRVVAVPRAAAPRARPGRARRRPHAGPRRRLRHRLPGRRRPRRRPAAWRTSCARSSPASAPRRGWPRPRSRSSRAGRSPGRAP